MPPGKSLDSRLKPPLELGLRDSGVFLLTEDEGVACGRCYDHDEGHGPLQQVRAQRRPEGLGGYPEVGVGQDALPVGRSNVSLCLSWGYVIIRARLVTYLPISRIIRDAPISTASRLPKALSKTSTFSAVSAPRLLNTVVKNTDAAISPELENSSFGTAQNARQHIYKLLRAIHPHPHLPPKLTSSKVRNVAEHVQHGDDDHRDGPVPLDHRNGPLDLVDHVEGVGIARVGEDDVD